MKKISQIARKYPLTLLCIALIWYLCVFFDMPETGLEDVPFIDKWTHFAMYGGTVSVMWAEYLRHHQKLNTARLVIFAFFAPILMSGVIELVQAYCTTNRQGEWLDLAANSTGVVLGNAIGAMMFCILKNTRRK